MTWPVLHPRRSAVWLAGCSLLALGAPAQPEPQATTGSAFDVVSVKPHRSGPGPSEGYGWSASPKGFSAFAIKPSMLMVLAYGLHTPDQIANLPAWGRADGFDIRAKTDEETVAAWKQLPDAEVDRRLQPMLRSMLSERFQLRIHHEIRELPVYNLVIAKGGTKLKASSSSDHPGTGMSNGYISGDGVPISALAFSLSNEIGRQVIDKTGLAGTYDYKLTWAPDDMLAAVDSSPAGDPGPSVFTAIQEQLGLKLVPSKGPVDVLVVDHIERPTAD